RRARRGLAARARSSAPRCPRARGLPRPRCQRAPAKCATRHPICRVRRAGPWPRRPSGLADGGRAELCRPATGGAGAAGAAGGAFAQCQRGAAPAGVHPPPHCRLCPPAPR
nr:hypothetical protein [Tanacetum cinerariifolium]